MHSVLDISDQDDNEFAIEHAHASPMHSKYANVGANARTDPQTRCYLNG